MPNLSAARRDPASLILALVLVLIGGYVLFATASMSAMGAVFPRTIAIVMIVTSVLLAAVKLYRPSARSDAEAGGSPVRRATLIAVVLAWAVLFPYVGFVVTGLVAFFLVCLIAEHDRLTVPRLLLFAVVDLVLVVGTWLLLASVLNVPFPRGVLF